jgi:hypothetical protein
MRSLTRLIQLLFFAGVSFGQTPTRELAKRPALEFQARPAKPAFARGEAVIFILSIRNESARPVFVSRLRNDEFVDFKVYGPNGKETEWRGNGRIDSKSYSSSDFVVLKAGETVRARRTLSLKDGLGFVIAKPGRYSVAAEYSLEPPEYFAPLAGNAAIPTGTFASHKATFCMATCGLNSQK